MRSDRRGNRNGQDKKSRFGRSNQALGVSYRLVAESQLLLAARIAVLSEENANVSSRKIAICSQVIHRPRTQKVPATPNRRRSLVVATMTRVKPV